MAMKKYSISPQTPKLEPCHHFCVTFRTLCRSTVGVFYSLRQQGSRVRVDLRVMAMKKYCTPPKTPRLEPYHHLSVTFRTLCRGAVGVFWKKVSRFFSFERDSWPSVARSWTMAVERKGICRTEYRLLLYWLRG